MNTIFPVRIKRNAVPPQCISVHRGSRSNAASPATELSARGILSNAEGLRI